MDFNTLLSNVQRTARASQRNGRDSERHEVSTPTGSQSQQHSRHRPPNNNNNNQQSRKRHRHTFRGQTFNFHEMRRAIATLQRQPMSPALPSGKDDDQPFHLALLFVTIDELPYEHIWKEWASQANDANLVQISVIVHSKYPNKIKSSWLKSKHLIQPPQQGRGTEYSSPRYHTRSPEWGSIEITRAMLDLIHEGLHVGVTGRNDDFRFSTDRYTLGGPPTQHVDAFAFVSESCLPVVPLKEFCANVRANRSWVNFRNAPNNGFSRQLQFDEIDPCITDCHKHKADQWCLLSHRHATILMDMDQHLPVPLWLCFLDTKASDELYIATSLSLSGILSEVEQKRLTYCDWSESAKNPATFSNGKEDLKRIVMLSLNEGCLFARKFATSSPLCKERTGDITVEDWKEIVM